MCAYKCWMYFNKQAFLFCQKLSYVALSLFISIQISAPPSQEDFINNYKIKLKPHIQSIYDVYGFFFMY